MEYLQTDTITLRELTIRYAPKTDVEGQPIVVGRYVDRVARVDGEWRFVRRRMIPEHWGDVAQHLTFSP